MKKRAEVSASVFQCLRCGFCCRNLRLNVGDFTLGLLLLPDEMALFNEDDLEPMWGVGLKGRSRPRPEAIGVVQLNLNVCPHITKDNRCSIYEKRPLICRAHPLTLRISPTGTVESASYNKKCPGTYVIPNYSVITLGEHFSNDMLRATAVLNSYFNKMFEHSKGLLWLFDLKSKQWHKANSQLVMRNLCV